MLAAVALIALVAALALPGAAQAQSVTTLVSNTGHMGSTSSANAIGAQPFTTGSAAVLTSVDVYLGANGGLGVEDIRVRILQDDSGSPGTELVTLPYLTAKIDNAVNTFTAPADTNLAAGTTYFVELSKNGDHGVNWSYTSSHLEDDGGATGWEISDTLYYKNSAGDPSWSTLSTGVMVIAIKGTAAGDTPTPCTVEVAIAADQPAFIARLDWVTFTLTRTGDAAAALDVAVALAQDQDLLASGNLAQTVSFGAADATATLTLYDFYFQTVTQETTLTATVQAGSGYAPGSPNTASTRMVVTDPAVTVWIEETAYTFAEDAADATVAVIARTATGVPVPNRDINLSLGLKNIPGQAVSNVDFEPLARTLRFRPSDFTSDGDAFTARKEVTLAIVDDALYEPDETTTLALEPALGLSSVVALRQADGTACRSSIRCDVTVTITDNDGSTDATLSRLSLGTGVTLDPTFAPGTTSYTAAVGNAVDEVTVTTTDTNATPEFLDASDTTLDDAGTAAGHQVALAVGDTVFKVKVTAEDTTTTKTYTVTVTRAAADTPPDAPTDFTATVGDAQVALGWKAPGLDSGVTGHEFRYKTDGDYPEDWTAIAYSGPDEANEDGSTVTGLTNEVAHTFELRAVNAAGGDDAATAGPVTPTPGICDRTQQIQVAILAPLSDVDDCAAVTVANLASIVTFGSFGLLNQGITSLQKGDFAGLTALTDLNLNENALDSLPGTVFSGLTDARKYSLMTYLNANNCPGSESSLPEDLFRFPRICSPA